MALENNARIDGLRRLFRFYSLLEEFASASNQKADALALLAWIQNKQGSTPSAVAAGLGFTPPKTTRLLQQLSTSGLLYEALDNSDLRKCCFFTTDEGDILVREAAETLGKQHFAKNQKRLSSIRAAALLLKQRFGIRLTFTAQRLLLVLSASDKPLNVGQLCEATSLPQPKASQALEALQNAGLVNRHILGNDNRKRHFVATQKGDRFAAYMFAQLESVGV